MEKNYLKLLENIRNNNKQFIIYNRSIDYNTQKFLKSLRIKGAKIIQNELLKYNGDKIEILVNELKNKF